MMLEVRCVPNSKKYGTQRKDTYETITTPTSPYGNDTCGSDWTPSIEQKWKQNHFDVL